jgi:hypothetical protein
MYYPSWRFHRTEPARIIADPTEEEALGEGWRDRPFDADELETADDSDATTEPDASEALAPAPEPTPKKKRAPLVIQYGRK